MIYALLGNENAGKTAVFNLLCKGHATSSPLGIPTALGKIEGTPHSLIDLPGIYSLSGATDKERAVLKYLKESPPDAILNVVDLASLTNGLYLTLALLTLRLPTVIALSGSDAYINRSQAIRPNALQEALGVPVVAVCAPKKEGGDALKKLLLQPKRPKDLPFSQEATPDFYKIALSFLSKRPSPRLALMLEEFWLSESPSLQTVNELKAAFPLSVLSSSPEKAEALILFRRKRAILLAERTFLHRNESQKFYSPDRFLLSGPFARVFPFFALFLLFILSLGPLTLAISRFLALFIGRFGDRLLLFLQSGDAAAPLVSLTVNCLLLGGGRVLSFTPMVLTFFFLSSLYKECGYASRVNLLFKVPFADESQNENIIACLLLSGFFFPLQAALFAFIFCLLLYAVSLIPRFFTKTLTKKEDYFILLPYRPPNLEKCISDALLVSFRLIKRCFSTVFLCIVGVWLLSSVTPAFTYTLEKEESVLALLSSPLLPLFFPLGITDWRIVTLFCITPLSKESVIGILSFLALGKDGGISSLFSSATALSSLTFMLHCPTYASLFSKRFSRRRGVLFFFLLRLVLAYFMAYFSFLLVSKLQILIL